MTSFKPRYLGDIIIIAGNLQKNLLLRDTREDSCQESSSKRLRWQNQCLAPGPIGKRWTGWQATNFIITVRKLPEKKVDGDGDGDAYGNVKLVFLFRDRYLHLSV